jgi:hypothetical protein
MSSDYGKPNLGCGKMSSDYGIPNSGCDKTNSDYDKPNSDCGKMNSDCRNLSCFLGFFVQFLGNAALTPIGGKVYEGELWVMGYKDKIDFGERGAGAFVLKAVAGCSLPFVLSY